MNRRLTLIAGWLLVLAATPATGDAATAGGTSRSTDNLAKSYAAVDEALKKFASRHSVGAATLAIAREGEILLARGYGWADAARRVPATADLRMRIASVSKVFTAAAARQLLREGKLTEDTKAFAFLGYNLTKRPGADPRLGQINVGHLLRHEGGWDRQLSYDPTFIDQRVSAALRLNRSPTLREVVEYMLTQPLQFDPGKRYAYSNFGYNVLGLVIERASGRPYSQYVSEDIFLSHGLIGIVPGADMPQVNEVWYDAPDPAGLNLGARLPSGGWVASAPDLCRFLNLYSISGNPRTSRGGRSRFFYGTLPGTTSLVLQRPDGTDVAVLLNKREPNFEAFTEELGKEIVRALDGPRQPSR